MSDIHIDDFYKDSALILLQLYSQFPRPITLFVEDIAGPDNEDEFGLHSPRHMACFSCINWLAESGYLVFQDTIRQDAMDQVVLTHKSFTLMSSPAQEQNPALNEDLPDLLQQSLSSNVALLREAIKSESTLLINKLMQTLFNESRQHAT